MDWVLSILWQTIIYENKIRQDVTFNCISTLYVCNNNLESEEGEKTAFLSFIK